MELTSYADNVFLGLPINIYSHILAIGVLVILVLTIVHIVAFLTSRKVREKTLSLKYHTFLAIIGVFALASTIFALVYQWGYMLLVCELCWWQRIFMFPIEFITISAIIKKSRGVHLAIGLLASFGIFFAGYHYYLHFNTWVMKNNDIMSFTSCGQGGILPSCTDPAGVVIFDFLTIPFMALVIFILILWLVFLASRREKIEKISLKN